MRWAVAFVVSGCNWIYGLDQTEVRDAGQFDAPIDAPFRCPSGAADGPTFSVKLQQHLAQDCDSFSQNATGQAVASCTPDGTIVSQVHVGDAGEPLVIAAGASIAGRTLLTPRLSPDGQRLLAVALDSPGSSAVQFSRETNGSWRRDADPPFGPVFRISPMASSPSGDRILVVGFPAYDVAEWERGGATWRLLRMHPLDDVYSVSLTHDGLAMLVMPRDLSGARYSDRTDLSQTFRPSVEAPGVPSNAEDPYMAPECSGVYLTGLSRIFFAQRQ